MFEYLKTNHTSGATEMVYINEWDEPELIARHCYTGRIVPNKKEGDQEFSMVATGVSRELSKYWQVK